MRTVEFAERCYKLGHKDAHREVESIPFEHTLNVAELESRAIREAMRVTGNDAKKAAKLCGIGKTTMYRKVREMGLATKLASAEFCPACGHRIAARPADVYGPETEGVHAVTA